MVVKLSQLYMDARRTLSQKEDQQTASMMARSLLCHVTGKSKEQLLADFDDYVTEKESAELSAAVWRVLTGTPLAYVIGEWDFYGMTLHVDKSVLIPRDDTCFWTSHPESLICVPVPAASVLLLPTG